MTVHNSDSPELSSVSKPGSFLAAEREKRGLSIEHIANKLNLRSQVLLHLEADEYDALPQAVFVKGYIRAYCKHLDLPHADDLIRAYSALIPAESKFATHLWQSRPPMDNQSGERWLHWVTGIFVLGLVAAGAMWLVDNKSSADFLPKDLFQSANRSTVVNPPADVKVTNLTKMRKLLNENTVEQSLTVPANLE